MQRQRWRERDQPLRGPGVCTDRSWSLRKRRKKSVGCGRAWAQEQDASDDSAHEEYNPDQHPEHI